MWSVAYDEASDSLVSGSADGGIRAWSLKHILATTNETKGNRIPLIFWIYHFPGTGTEHVEEEKTINNVGEKNEAFCEVRIPSEERISIRALSVLRSHEGPGSKERIAVYCSTSCGVWAFREKGSLT